MSYHHTHPDPAVNAQFPRIRLWSCGIAGGFYQPEAPARESESLAGASGYCALRIPQSRNEAWAAFGNQMQPVNGDVGKPLGPPVGPFDHDFANGVVFP